MKIALKKIGSLLVLFLAVINLNAQIGKNRETTAANDTTVYFAGFETNRAIIEEQLFSNIQRVRANINKLVYPGSRLLPSNADNRQWAILPPKSKIGPAILLKVDSADKFEIFVEGFSQYLKNGKPLDAFRNEIPKAAGILLPPLFLGRGLAGDKLLFKGSSPQNIAGALRFFEKDDEGSKNKLARLKWALLDSNLNIYNKELIGSLPVSEPGKMNVLVKRNLQAFQKGYILVFLSNESNTNVYFDNLMLKQIKTPVSFSLLSISYIITEDNIDITTETGINLTTEN